MHPFPPSYHPHIYSYIHENICVCICVCIVGFYAFISHFLVFTQRRRRSIKTSYKKIKEVVTFILLRKKIRKCPKSQEGTCPAEIRALLLQRYGSVPLGICIFQRVFK